MLRSWLTTHIISYNQYHLFFRHKEWQQLHLMMIVQFLSFVPKRKGVLDLGSLCRIEEGAIERWHITSYKIHPNCTFAVRGHFRGAVDEFPATSLCSILHEGLSFIQRADP